MKIVWPPFGQKREGAAPQKTPGRVLPFPSRLPKRVIPADEQARFDAMVRKWQGDLGDWNSVGIDNSKPDE